MSHWVIYHNPRCSKSRQTLALLEEKGIDPEIVLYLKQPLTVDDLGDLLVKLDLDAGQLLRSKEAVAKELGLTKASKTRDILSAMVEHPQLIERPIVVCGDRAVLGRPR